ncbi:MAG: 16S rRNA (adenine(1518)-N(6)/adenine(1519)-N(6)) -dimethyltransferase RsmA [Roseovarius sp.]
MSGLDALPPLRAVIARHGLAPRRALGQNFLLDLNLTAKIARAAGDLTCADVLEIGPGPGGLTRALLAAGARHVLAIEKDSRCLPALAEIAAACPGRLTVIAGDALAIDPRAHLAAPVKVVANLPYNVGTELLVRWLSPPQWPPFWESLTLMFQREVAERIVARPGSKAYGRLAILAQWRSEARIVMHLPAQAFTPPPKVSSSVVQLTALPGPRHPADPEILQRLVARAFGQRRKMLRAALKGLDADIEARLAAAGIAPTDRAEAVELEKFCALARELARELAGELAASRGHAPMARPDAEGAADEGGHAGADRTRPDPGTRG